MTAATTLAWSTSTPAARFKMLVDRLQQRHEGVALLLEILAEKPRLIGGFHLNPEIRPMLGGLLDAIVVGQARLHRLVVLSARFAGDVERERLVGLFRGALGDLCPKILLGHRRDVAERAGPLNSGVDGGL